MENNSIVNKMLVFANKFSSQRHIAAIRDGFGFDSTDNHRIFLGVGEQFTFEPYKWSFEECDCSGKMDGFGQSSLQCFIGNFGYLNRSYDWL